MQQMLERSFSVGKVHKAAEAVLRLTDNVADKLEAEITNSIAEDDDSDVLVEKSTHWSETQLFDALDDLGDAIG